MSHAVFDPDARLEFLAAIEYYQECRNGLGVRFRVAVEKAVQDICEMPFRYRVFHAPLRRCLIPKFPYALIFSIEPEHILIIAVAHTKRKPGYWRERAKS